MALTQQQLEARRAGIGGSDAGAVLGLNPYKTPVDVYLEKVNPAIVQEPDNDAMYWGTVLEDTIATEYARRTGFKVQRRNQQFQSQEFPWMLANIDRHIVGQARPLECKTAGQYMSDKWGPSGTDLVPDSYLIQVHHYMIVIGADSADLAVLIGGRDFRTYTIGLDRELADIIIEQERLFWHDHVLANVPPPPTTLNDLLELYPSDTGFNVVATQDIELAIDELKGIKATIKTYEQEKDRLELEIKNALADGSALVGVDGKVLATWKRTKDGKRFDAKKFQAENPELAADYMIPTPGQRRFLVK